MFLPDSTCREILANYDIGEVRGCEFLNGGMFLKPLLVISETGNYVLRGHGFRNTAPSFQFQADVLSHVRGKGITVPLAIPDSQGRLGQPRGPAFWALHEYID